MTDKAEKKKHRVGDEVTVRKNATVIRPDGGELTVVGGVYVLDVPGTHNVAGEDVEVS
jgi:hypothetical protein